jgi:hypothetical protein
VVNIGNISLHGLLTPKRNVYEFVLSNCTWEDAEVVATFRQPFDWHCHAASGLRSRWRFGSQGDEENHYRGYRFPPEIIQQAIWLYLRFTLSLRDVEDLLVERGIMVSYSY